MTRKNLFFASLLIFLEGYCVLSLEILGTRLLGPAFGASINLWAALIAVTLLSLSLGYCLGGRLADRYKRREILIVIVWLSAVWTLVIPFIKKDTVETFSFLGLKWDMLLSSALLFTFPLTMLGMVTPFILRMCVENLSTIGHIAGRLYATSTVASVFAAILTGFFFIPVFGTFNVAMLVVLVLTVMSLLSAYIYCGNVRGLPLAINVPLILLAVGLIVFNKPDYDKRLLEVQHSQYGEIRVIDLDWGKFLVIEGEIHSGIRKFSDHSTYVYPILLQTAKDLFDTPGDGLVIGLGAGTTIKPFVDANWRMSAVEINPVVIDMAYKHFGLDIPRSKVHTLDGRRFLHETDKSFDVIAFDAYGGSGIPFHLITQEVFELAKQRLNQKGVLGLNVIGDGWDSLLLHSILKTLDLVFTHVIALPASADKAGIQNFIVFASDSEITPKLQNYLRKESHENDFYRIIIAQPFKNIFTSKPHGIILTDNHNPADLWGDEINFKIRSTKSQTVDRSLLW
jgi:spermidine synthase